MHRFLFLLAFCSPAASAGGQALSIDAQYRLCLQENVSTFGAVGCAQEAELAWDREMNQTYQQLLEILSPALQAKLKSAQRAWLNYRDQEFALATALYNDLPGTMWIPAAAGSRVELVRKRTLELKVYLENFRGAK